MFTRQLEIHIPPPRKQGNSGGRSFLTQYMCNSGKWHIPSPVLYCLWLTVFVVYATTLNTDKARCYGALVCGYRRSVAP